MIYRRPPRAAFVFSEDDPVELHVKVLPDGEVHVMAGPAALIWMYATEGHSDIPARVAREIGIAPAMIIEDVAAFLDRLVDLELLEPAETS